MVVKKDGTRAPFSREKVLAGIMKACEKRPIPMAKIEALVNQVEKYVQESRERERSTEKIGEQIMRRLKELDKVAYVRFASVGLYVHTWLAALSTPVCADPSGLKMR